jgi:hypothetical protein
MERSKYAVRQCSLWPATILVDCEFKVHHLAVSAFDLLGRSGGSRRNGFADFRRAISDGELLPFSSARMTSTVVAPGQTIFRHGCLCRASSNAFLFFICLGGSFSVRPSGAPPDLPVNKMANSTAPIATIAIIARSDFFSMFGVFILFPDMRSQVQSKCHSIQRVR